MMMVAAVVWRIVVVVVVVMAAILCECQEGCDLRQPRKCVCIYL